MNRAERLCFAVAGNGHTECGEHLLKAGADMNITDESGESVLVASTREGHINFVRELIAAGVNVNTGTYLPLIKSVEKHNFLLVEELMKAGADVNAKDEDGNTALMAAVDIGNEPLVQFL